MEDKKSPAISLDMEHPVNSTVPPNMATLDSEIHSSDNETSSSSSQASEAPHLERIDSSIRRPPVKVPRSERRGLLARFALIPEVENPYDYSRSMKWGITATIGLAAVAAPLGSANLLPALSDVRRSLHTSSTITNLAVALYMLSLSIFPLWWSSFSERFGRRSIFIVSFGFFMLWATLAAVSKNITMLIIMRILSGGAAASVQAVGAGSIADCWEPFERGQAMATFYLGPLMGPLIGPIVGGGLAQRWGWRATQWMLVIYGGIVFVLLILLVPETLKKKVALVDTDTEKNEPLTRVSTRKSVADKTKRAAAFMKFAILDPLYSITYLRFPAVFITVYYVSITFGSLYVLNISIETTFSRAPYNFSTLIVGLLYIPGGLGYLLGSLAGGRWSDRIMAREAKSAGRIDARGHLILIPEDRMRENAWLAAIMYPLALMWYGWAAEKGVYWIVPLIANFFFGFGSMIVFAMGTTMLTEFLPGRSSTGVAANNFVRNIFSAVGGVVAGPLISAIGNGWLFTGLGVIALASSVIIWCMRKYGPHWRVSMESHLADLKS